MVDKYDWRPRRKFERNYRTVPISTNPRMRPRYLKLVTFGYAGGRPLVQGHQAGG